MVLQNVSHLSEPINEELPSKCAFTVYAIMGVINLLAGPYVIVVRERRAIGELFDAAVWHVGAVEILPCAVNGNEKLSPAQLSDESQYLTLLKSFLQEGGFYYSHGYDLTSCLQHHHRSHQFTSFLTLPYSVFTYEHD